MKPDQLNITEQNAHGKTSLMDEIYLKYLPVNNPGIVAIIRDDDMKILFTNQQFEHYLGYTQADLFDKGVCFSDLLERYQHDHLVNQLDHVNDNIEARSRFVIYRLKRKDGTSNPYYLYAAPFIAEDQPYGKLYFLLLHPDLSKFGMPFTSFESKELFLEQFEGQYFGTCEWLLDTNKIFCSVGIYRIYETNENKHDMHTLFPDEFVHPNDKTKVADAVAQSLRTGEDINIEYRIITPKKNVKLLHCLARPTRDSNGRPIKFAGSIRDITAHRSIEEALKNKVEELNHSNRDLEEFAYIASHDMQEPLRKITTFSDRLSEKYKDLLTGEGEMYLSRIIASAENMRSLINDLLEFSRISKTEQPFETVDLNLILRQVKNELELTIEETGTTISADKLPDIEAIPVQMKQLFVNIIGNAIKFRKQGIKPVIKIEATLLTEKEKLKYDLAHNLPYYKIQIVDNGIGFEPEYALRIFQVFQRLHGKSEYPGSGIGLAICKKILEYHNGTIYAENVPGKGARFLFMLPQHQQNAKDNNL